jgi:predicted nucleic acid-binding protein
LARRYGLTTYEATYLDLAMRRGLPLATRDRELSVAATKARVELIDT